MKKASILFALFFLFPYAIYANVSKISKIEKELRQQDKELKEIQKEIRKGQKKLKRIKKEEKNALKQLHQTENNLYLTYRYIKKLSGKQDNLTKQIAALQDRIAILTDSLNQRKKQMGKRLRTIYKKGDPGLLDAFLGASSLENGFERNRFFRALHEYDRRLLNKIIGTKQRVEAEKQQLEEKLIEVSQTYEEKKIRQKRLLKQKQGKYSVLQVIKSKKTTYEQLVQELKTSQKGISRLIGALEKTKKKEIKKGRGKKRLVQRRAVKKYKGNILWPVKGRIIRKFGKFRNKKYKTVTINAGIDIKAKEGQPIVAVAKGKVVYIGYMRGYGNILIVGHESGYYSLYAHLLDIVVDDKQNVDAGQLIGRVGETGSFDGAKLHFEFRKGKKVLDPEKWLPRRK